MTHSLQTIDANGTCLAYLEQGQGEPLLFIHGSLDDLRSWRLQMERFAERYHVIAYSRRYHYPNDFDERGPEYSALLHAEDLAGLVAALGLGPAHLVASSFGGYVALCFTARHLAAVRSLVLGEPPLMPWLAATPEGTLLAETFDREAWQPARGAFLAGDLEAGARFFLDGVTGRDTFNRLPPAGRRMMLDNARELRAECLSGTFFSAFGPDDAARIARPVLLLDGEFSPRMFYVITGELERCLPDTERAVLPGASHAMHLGNPDAYAARVLAFLARH